MYIEGISDKSSKPTEGGNDHNNNNRKYDQNGQKPNNRNDNNNFKNKFSDRKLYKLYNQPLGGFYSGKSTDDIRTILKNKGLDEIVEDLYDWRENSKPRPEYVMNAIYDPLFVAAFNKKLIKKLSKMDDAKLAPFYAEINIAMTNMRRRKQDNIYTPELIADLVKVYQSVLARSDNDLLSKLVAEFDMEEDDATQIVILTAGKNPGKSLYNLNNYLYYNVCERERKQFSLSVKSLRKLYKLIYGKKNMDKVIVTLMLEKNIKATLAVKSSKASQLWSTINDMVLTTLNDMEKKEIKKIMTDFVTRRRQDESRGSHVDRRLGNYKSIHADDYSKIIDVIEDLIDNDIMIKQWLTK